MLPSLSGLSSEGYNVEVSWVPRNETCSDVPFQASFFADYSQAACAHGPSEEKHTRSQPEWVIIHSVSSTRRRRRHDEPARHPSHCSRELPPLVLEGMVQNQSAEEGKVDKWKRKICIALKSIRFHNMQGNRMKWERREKAGSMEIWEAKTDF